MRGHVGGAMSALLPLVLLPFVSVFAAPMAVTVTTSISPTPLFSSAVAGVNVGHAFDASWAVYMKRLGVNGAPL